MRRLTTARDRDWLLLSHDTARIADPSQGRVIGRVRLAEAALPLPARIRLGWFLTEAGRAATDPRLAEGRMELVATEDPAEFAFTIDAAALAQQHAHPFCTLWIDLVREGEHWFYQPEGGGALRIDVALPSPLLGDAFGMAMLQTMLAGTGQHTLFHAIRRAEERHAIGRMLRERLLYPEALLPASCPPRPPLRAQLHDEHAPVMETAATAEARHLPDQLSAALLQGTPWPGFAPSDIAYFQRGRLAHQRTGLPLTQAMLDAMALVEPALLADALDNPDALRRWWLFDILLAHRLPIEALPPDHRRHWLAPFLSDDIAPANRFMIEAWERATGAARGHDPLQDAAERLAFQLEQVLGIWRDHRLSGLLGREAQDFWAQPIVLAGQQVTLFILLACMAQPVHAPMPGRGQAQALLDHCEALAARLAAACPALAPLLGRHARAAAPAREPAYLLGFRHEFGAAQALRGAAASLTRQGIAMRLFDAQARQPLAFSDGRLRGWSEGASNPPGEGLERPVSLFFGKPSRMPGLIRDQALVGITARWRIGIFGWAFADLPAAEIAGAREMDVIGVASGFTRDAFRRATGRQVTIIAPMLELSETPADPYAELIEARAGRFVFHAPVRAGAGLRQVNPSAVVSAFAQAFPTGCEPAVLVLHAPEAIGADGTDPLGEWAMIQAAAAADPRIILVEETAGRERLLGFIAHADCVVSAHRCTGFGTHCAETLAYGVPLIATGYSGNLDYCDAQNSWLVEYQLRDIRPGEYPQDIASQWADVRLDHLAAQMQAVLAEPAKARQMAALGRQKVRVAYTAGALDAALGRALQG
ncbi:MAG: hypothetical protein NTW56_12965 [Alphaproteobacteria bacterium]|nr:hypothetical protein [Alphaproteobacteria bacterium]